MYSKAYYLSLMGLDRFSPTTAERHSGATSVDAGRQQMAGDIQSLLGIPDDLDMQEFRSLFSVKGLW